MLVGRALVAVYGYSLVHHLAVAVVLLTKALHHQLLEIATEDLQPIAIWEHNHVAFALAMAGDKPCGSHQGSRVMEQI